MRHACSSLGGGRTMPLVHEVTSSGTRLHLNLLHLGMVWRVVVVERYHLNLRGSGKLKETN